MGLVIEELEVVGPLVPLVWIVVRARSRCSICASLESLLHAERNILGLEFGLEHALEILALRVEVGAWTDEFAG